MPPCETAVEVGVHDGLRDRVSARRGSPPVARGLTGEAGWSDRWRVLPVDGAWRNGPGDRCDRACTHVPSARAPAPRCPPRAGSARGRKRSRPRPGTSSPGWRSARPYSARTAATRPPQPSAPRPATGCARPPPRTRSPRASSRRSGGTGWTASALTWAPRPSGAPGPCKPAHSPWARTWSSAGGPRCAWPCTRPRTWCSSARGARPAGGIGREGDALERHADAVAARVEAGGSAEGLLDQVPGAAAPFAAPAAAPVQRVKRTEEESPEKESTVTKKIRKETYIRRTPPERRCWTSADWRLPSCCAAGP